MLKSKVFKSCQTIKRVVVSYWLHQCNVAGLQYDGVRVWLKGDHRTCPEHITMRIGHRYYRVFVEDRHPIGKNGLVDHLVEAA